MSADVITLVVVLTLTTIAEVAVFFLSADVVTIVAVFVVATAIEAVALLWFFHRRYSDPKFTGDPVPGTAQVTSVEVVGGLFSRYGRPAQVKCEFGLRVHLPDQPTFDTTIRQSVGARRVDLPTELQLSEMYNGAEPYDGPKLRPGTTVVVVADSANPRVVRIDLTQPVTKGDPVT